MSVQTVSPTDCRLPIAGHEVHWIQVKRSDISEKGPVRLISTQRNFITFGNEEKTWTWWHHDPKKLQSWLKKQQSDPDVNFHFRPRWSLLCLSVAPGRTKFIRSKPGVPSIRGRNPARHSRVYNCGTSAQSKQRNSNFSRSGRRYCDSIFPRQSSSAHYSTVRVRPCSSVAAKCSYFPNLCHHNIAAHGPGGARKLESTLTQL